MNKKLLIIDDHELIYQGLKGQIGNNIDLLYASSGRQATEMIYNNSMEYAIIDITIGQDNGFDIAYNFKNHIPWIFFLSMHKSPLYIQKAIDEGYNGYFLKDEPLDLLHDALINPAKETFWMTGQVSSLISQDYKIDTELYDRLSPREQQILRLIAEGIGYKEIGSSLNISAKTVNVHRANIMKKLGLEKQLDIVKYAIKIGLIDL